jgi:hypothetical protein
MKLGAVKGIFYLRASMKFCPYFLHFGPISIKFGTEEFHIMPWSSYDDDGKRYNEDLN